jgi:uncharacterized protein YjbI with pentapeptide repeats
MANPEQLEILNQGLMVWNQWRKEHPSDEIDLSESTLSRTVLQKADLIGVNLRQAELMRADLFGANLKNAYLGGAYLSEAYLARANLTTADLVGAHFNGADLSGADLTGGDLTGADLSGANLSKADLTRAILYGTKLKDTDLTGANLNGTSFRRALLFSTKLGDVDLSKAVGLEEANHFSSSVISTGTIQLSKGKIPLAFLRGCGLSDVDIEYAKLAVPGLDPEQVTVITHEIYQKYVGNPIQYCSCFISYNDKDEEFTKRLHDNLQDKGIRCWFAPEDIQIGDRLRTTIGEQARLRDKLLVILSVNSIQSEWIGHEAEKAIAEEKEHGGLKLFAIRLDDAALKAKDGWAETIRLGRTIEDFSNWKNQIDYENAFERLLGDLKASNTSP